MEEKDFSIKRNQQENRNEMPLLTAVFHRSPSNPGRAAGFLESRCPACFLLSVPPDGAKDSGIWMFFTKNQRK